MIIGLKIRELRKKRGMTQEELASHLNVSSKAVSKWENGNAYPDITLIPSIASVFEVSTDNLFGIHDNIENERTKELRVEYSRLCQNGDNKGRVALMREALSEYPHNYEFMNNLARSLFRAANSRGCLDEAISLCKTVILNSNDEFIRCSAIQTISRAYSYIGEKELALKYAKELPPMQFSQEQALEWALSGEERNYQIQYNTIELLVDVSSKLLSRVGIGAGPHAFLEDKLTLQQELYIYEVVERLLTTVFNDDNYGVVSGKLAQIHRFSARCYAKAGKCEETMKELYLSEKYADDFENNKNKGIKYTSLFFDRLTFDFSGTRHWDSNEYGRILRKIRQWDCFDFIRDTPEFIEFEKRIEQKSKSY